MTVNEYSCINRVPFINIFLGNKTSQKGLNHLEMALNKALLMGRINFLDPLLLTFINYFMEKLKSSLFSFAYNYKKYYFGW